MQDRCNTTRFMIVAQARSGSTFLREALNDQPDITCHGEVFSRVWIDRLVTRPGMLPPTSSQTRAMLPRRDADPLAFMAEQIMAFPTRATGFKIVYDDFIDDRFHEPLTRFGRDKGVKVIHLRRLNPLAALVSRTRMFRFGLSHSDKPRRTDGGREAPRKITIPPAEVERYARRQNMLAAGVDERFPDALQLRYETLHEDFPAIFTHLGLPADREFGAGLRKMTPTSLSDVIENYHELAQYDRPEQPVW